MNARSPWNLRAALTLFLGASLIPIAVGQTAPASDEKKDEAVKLDKFEVTGSRITGAAAESSLSVSIYDMDTDLSLQGYSDFGQMLRTRLPQYGGGVGTINDSFGNGGNGMATISLRNLPGSRSLFLVNGRRTSADLNLIPTTAIESIEVLNDGAGAVYGSEAIAGVVNVKLKKNYNGVFASARYANTTTTDISERRFSVLLGASSGSVRATVAYQYSKANDQLSADRSVSLPTGDMVSGTSNPGLFVPRATLAMRQAANALLPTDPGYDAATTGANVLVPLRWFVNADVTSGLTPGVSLPAAFDPLAFLTLPATMPAAQRNAARDAEEAARNGLMGANSPVLYGPNYVYSSLGDLNPGFPYGYYTPAYRRYERGALTANLEKDFFDGQMTVFAELLFATNDSLNMLAPSPLGGTVVPATNYWVSQILSGLPADASFTYGYRPTELGPRVTTGTFESRRFVVGVKGTAADDKWNYEVAYTGDRLTYRNTQSGGVYASVYLDALAGTTADTAFNPFGATPLFGTSSPVNSDELIASFAGSADAYERYDTDTIDATISGSLFSLPAGDLAIAIGAEYREEISRDEPSQALVNGDVFPFNAAPPLAGSRDITSFYAEVKVPVLDSLSFDIAARREKYSDVGSTGVKPRVAFRWEPLKDELTIRGSWAQGFVAPSVFALVPGDLGQSFDELYNPITGTRTQPSDGVYYVGNPNLKPTESDSYLVGVVYSPKTLKRLTVGANYYRIEESGIPFTSPQYIVTQWAANGGPDNASNPFGPNAQPSAVNPTGAQVEVQPSGELEVVRNVGTVNSGDRVTDGIDLFAHYRIDTDVGEFGVSTSWTRVLTFEQEDFPGAGKIDYLGKYWGSGAALGNYGFPKWKGSVSLEWKKDKLMAALAYNYTSGYLEDENNNNPVEAWQTFDVRIAYTLPWIDANLVVGANNVFDEPPPFVVTSFENGFDRAVSDIRGRMVFIELSKKF